MDKMLRRNWNMLLISQFFIRIIQIQDPEFYILKESENSGPINDRQRERDTSCCVIQNWTPRIRSGSVHCLPHTIFSIVPMWGCSIWSIPHHQLSTKNRRETPKRNTRRERTQSCTSHSFCPGLSKDSNPLTIKVWKHDKFFWWKIKI